MPDDDEHGSDINPDSIQKTTPAEKPSESEENACLLNNSCKSTPGDETKHIVKIPPYFPVRNRKIISGANNQADVDSWEKGSGAFGSKRKRKKDGVVDNRAHAGCDIYVEKEGESVYAVKSGTIVSCIESPRDGWGKTQWIAIDHGDFIARYCEVSDLTKTSGKVFQGEIIAKVKTTTFAPKQPMLHLEIYNKEATGSFDVEFDKSAKVNGWFTGRRSDLVNPSDYLNQWKNNLPQDTPKSE